MKVRGNQKMEPAFTAHLCVPRAGIHGALRMSDTVPGNCARSFNLHGSCVISIFTGEEMEAGKVSSMPKMTQLAEKELRPGPAQSAPEPLLRPTMLCSLQIDPVLTRTLCGRDCYHPI